jgi:cytoskeletal protein RodZ
VSAMETELSSTEPDRIVKITEIGSLFNETRQKKQITLEEVAAKTQIRLSLLKAIESGQIDLLPEPVYTRGLIKQFGDALGLNGKEIANSFPLAYTSKLKKSSSINIRPTQIRPLHLYFLYIILVIGSVNYISYLLNQATLKTGNETVYKQTDKTIVSTSDRSSISGSSVDRNINSNNSSIDQSLRVGIALKSSSWIKVVADGKTQFEGVLESGQQRTWVAKQQLTVTAGNAGGVMVAFNDQKAKQLGKPGQPKEVTFGNNRKS